jgi:hypothetical protein
MALKAGLVFLVAYFGLIVAIVLPVIVNDAPRRHPGLWRYIHMAPGWVSPGAGCGINLDTLQKWVRYDHAVHEFADLPDCGQEGESG